MSKTSLQGREGKGCIQEKEQKQTNKNKDSQNKLKVVE